MHSLPSPQGDENPRVAIEQGQLQSPVGKGIKGQQTTVDPPGRRPEIAPAQVLQHDGAFTKPNNLMKNTLTGKKIAFLATDGFEQVELTKPLEAVRNAGAQTSLVSLEKGKIQGVNHDENADRFEVDRTVDQTTASEYDGLVLPGGVFNPDALRLSEDAIKFVRDFFDQNKPVAAVCHGPWTLIEAGVVRGRKMTSWPSLKTDLENAGATWVDEECVSDEALTTSRNPDDLPAFCDRIVKEFSGANQNEQKA